MLRLDDYMRRANTAYYARHDPFRDFTTAPEISQAFGELLGLWAATVWMDMGSPDQVILAECGPGRGTLMRDALRAIDQAAPLFRQALRLHLVENSPRLRDMQQADLPVAAFHDRCDGLPDGPLILLANEFLDALPIRQVIRRGESWVERCVEENTATDAPCIAEFPTPPAEPEDGAIWEINETALAIAAQLGRRFAAQPGVALFIDYGPAQSGFGDSLQALRGGQPSDPFTDPGGADLTAHVDFAALCRTASEAGGCCFGPLPQGALLTRLGLFARLHHLAQGKPPAQAMAILQAGSRLAEPAQMGSLFKAMVICHSGFCPPGFAA